MKKPPSMPFGERLFCSVADAVAATSLSRSKLYELMRLGRIKYKKAGARRLVFVASLKSL